MQRLRDSEVEQRVLRELQLQPEIRSKELCVWSSEGVVTLSGTVNDHHHKGFAQKAAERAVGVLSVVIDIKVREPEVSRASVSRVPSLWTFSATLKSNRTRAFFSELEP